MKDTRMTLEQMAQKLYEDMNSWTPEEKTETADSLRQAYGLPPLKPPKTATQ